MAARSIPRLPVVALALLTVVGCGSAGTSAGAGGGGNAGSSGSSVAGGGTGGAQSGGGGGSTASSGGRSGTAGSGGSRAGDGDASSGGHAGSKSDASADAAGHSSDAGAPSDTLESNRRRLLQTYFDFLKANATQPQTNGLSGSNVATLCDLWQKLDASSQAVFLTLTARLQGSFLGIDGSSMLSHVVKLYRVTGGQGASGSNAGTCGGGEYNRMIMSMDAELHDAQLAASLHQGSLQPNGKYDIADIPANTFWRDSHDLGGAHSPFDLSDETNQGAPRGQTQYFQDPGSTLAHSPLGRTDLATLVDPYAIELDQDYDCTHNSNPTCAYVTYGALCALEPSALGTDIYAMSYGSFGAGWAPVCNAN